MAAQDHPVPFQAHVDLLHAFISQREPIVQRIQAWLGAQQKLAPSQWHRPLLASQFEDCFFVQSESASRHLTLRGQLQQAHWDEGFKPRVMPGIPNEMFDPAEMVTRAFTVWHHTRWPGRNGRLHFAHTLFNLYVVRCLTLLVMRVCDGGQTGAGERIALLKQVLRSLWTSSPAGQPVLVRDVRWLVPVAQSPTTDDLGTYFEAARRMEECLPDADRLEIHKASLLMAGGHLRSQLRHFNMQGRSLEDQGILLSTRSSNALDYAMSIQHLVPLLEAYEQSLHRADTDQRNNLAGIICQGLSPDPDLFVNHLDVLAAYSTVEHLFAKADGQQIVLSATGQRHAGLARRYAALIERLASALYDDCLQFRPVAGSYSPYGVLFGFSSNILEHMTIKALQPEAETRFSLEDVFADRGSGAERLAWVSGWRQLPHVPRDVQKMYEYPQQFAEQVFARLERALHRRTNPVTPPGRLCLNRASAPQLSADYIHSSDPAIVAAGVAQARETARLVADRLEGVHLLSYQTEGGWVAISKDLLTEQLGAGHDITIPGLPAQAAQTLQVLYSGLIAVD